MSNHCRGRYRARFGADARDVDAARRLRHTAFVTGRAGLRQGDGGGGRARLDGDAFDEICRHVLIEDRESGKLMGCFRLLELSGKVTVQRSYSAQFYDLSALQAYPGRILEMGRFCTDPAQTDPDILRMAWGFVTRLVDRRGIALLMGCSSFQGTDPAPYLSAFALLQARHQAPARWRPGMSARDGLRLADLPGLPVAPDPRRAMREMPPLLRSYLALGGWVSDHAVIDRHLDTMHVFTGVEIGAIPPARARLMRAAARAEPAEAGGLRQ